VFCFFVFKKEKGKQKKKRRALLSSPTPPPPPPPPRQPFAVVCFDMQGFNPRSERSGPTTRLQSIPRFKSLKLLHLEYAENSTSGRGRARFYVTRKRNIAQV